MVGHQDGEQPEHSWASWACCSGSCVALSSPLEICRGKKLTGTTKARGKDCDRGWGWGDGGGSLSILSQLLSNWASGGSLLTCRSLEVRGGKETRRSQQPPAMQGHSQSGPQISAALPLPASQELGLGKWVEAELLIIPKSNLRYTSSSDAENVHFWEVPGDRGQGRGRGCGWG